MLTYAMWNNEPVTEKEIVRISYRVVSAKRFKAMTPEQRKNLIGMITRFETCLKATKKELRKSK